MSAAQLLSALPSAVPAGADPALRPGAPSRLPAALAGRSFGDALVAARVGAVPGGAPARLPGVGAPDGAGAAALEVLGRVERARVRLDAALAEARRGRSFTAAELLCLQADAHRFAQTVEIVARAAEHGVQAVKQAIHTQV